MGAIAIEAGTLRTAASRHKTREFLHEIAPRGDARPEIPDRRSVAAPVRRYNLSLR
jgi:hypothetical protein